MKQHSKTAESQKELKVASQNTIDMRLKIEHRMGSQKPIELNPLAQTRPEKMSAANTDQGAAQLLGCNSAFVVTEDHRKEKDMPEPRVKIRHVAVVGPSKNTESYDVQKYAKQINLKANAGL